MISDPTISLSYIFQRNDNKAQNKYLYTYIQSNTIPNSPRVETIQIYVNRWMDKQSMIYPHNGILFSPEKRRKFWSIQCGWTLKTLKWSRLVMSDSMWPRDCSPPSSLRSWDSPGKNTGVGCLYAWWKKPDMKGHILYDLCETSGICTP